MSPRVERNEAELRLRNTESLRAMLWRRIRIAVENGKLTEREARDLRRQFWNERLEDSKKLRRRA